MKSTPHDAMRRASEVLYEEILLSRNSLRRTNVEALKQVCDQMEKDNVIISAAEVVRRCRGEGPAYSTVSNKGSDLGEYIRLRVNEQAATRTSNTNSAVCVADLIHDPVLQARTRDIESRLRWIDRENKALRTLFKTLRPGINLDEMISTGPSETGALKLTQGKTRLEVIDIPQVASAVMSLVTHLIRDRQYCIHRSRLCINNKIVLSPHELRALRETTGLSEEEWAARFEAQEPN